jgi:hypothetical protein
VGFDFVGEEDLGDAFELDQGIGHGRWVGWREQGKGNRGKVGGPRGQVSERSASVATSTTREVRMRRSGITERKGGEFIAGAGESGGGEF